MPTLFFPERDTLRLVLASGAIAASVTQVPTEAGWDEQGRLWLTTHTSLPRETLAAIQRFGVRIVGSNAAAGTFSVSCWQQIVPLERTAQPPGSADVPVLFNLSGRTFGHFAGELERCGAKYSFAWADDIEQESGADRVLVKVESPPLFTLLRVQEGNHSNSSIAAYIEDAPRVWTAVGWHHPFVDQIAVPPGKHLFLKPPAHWSWGTAHSFQKIGATPTLAHTGGEKYAAIPSNLARIPIPLRLVESDDAHPAEMWMIRDDAFGWLERFLQHADESLLYRFTCAVASRDGNPMIVLRIRGKGPLPILVEAPSRFRPLLKLGNLFLPCGYMLAPLPRRDSIRQLLSPDPKRITWLHHLDDGNFTVESIAASIFRPLAEYVEYRTGMPTLSRRTWTQSSTWGYERFAVRPNERAAVARGSTESPRPVKRVEVPANAEERRPKRSWWSRTVGWLLRAKRPAAKPADLPPEEIEAPAISMDEAVRTALPPSPSRTSTPLLRLEDAKDRARVLARQFHDSVDTLTPQERLELWPELAAAFAQASQPGDAALCWLNALWEQDRPSSLWAWGWFKAEASLAGWSAHDAQLRRWLAAPPDKFRPRAVAAYALFATLQDAPPDGFESQISGLNAYLDANEHALPIRAAWLVRTALAKSNRGDVLSLARTRDRLLARLGEHGMSLAGDVPSFVRSAGSDDPDRLNQVGKWLSSKRRPIHDWIALLGPEMPGGNPERRQPFLYELEAEVPCTQAYADLMIAWGLNRLGENSEASRLRDAAFKVLPEGDPIHAILRSAFDFRLAEARESQTAAPMPSVLQTRLEALSSNDRYRVDRLRQHSRILEPTERIDVWAATMQHFRGWDELRRLLIELPRLERSDLNRRVRILLERMDQYEMGARAAILLAVLALANRIDTASIETAIDRALALPGGSEPMFLRVLERGLQAAATLGLDGKARLLVHRFAGFVDEQKGQSSPALLEGLTGQSFRCLRKLGMKEEANQVLTRIALWLTRGADLKDLRRTRVSDWPVLLRTLLHVAAGWYFCGRGTEGHRIIEEARTRDLFYDGTMSVQDRTTLALAYAGAIGQIPTKIAQGCYEELFTRLKKVSVNGWNSHYTLQPLELVDTVVRSVVSDDFTLGPAVRGWLDDDEFNIRQRIHREMKTWMESQGI